MGSRMIQVYRLPAKLTDGFCFGHGKPVTFTNVDWFTSEPPEGMGISLPTEDELRVFIASKSYYDPGFRFLVLDDRPGRTFVIEGK